MLGWQGTESHALYAPIPRGTACPASGFGSRGPAREAEAGGQGVQGAVAVPAGKDAVLYRQRPEAILSRLLHRQARQLLRLGDGDGGRLLPRGAGGGGA